MRSHAKAPSVGSSTRLVGLGRSASLVLAAIAVAAVAFATAPAGAAPPTHPPFPNLSHEGLPSVCGVATDPAGDLYVSESSAQSVRIYAPDGSFVKSFSTSAGPLATPCQIAVSSTGDVYVNNNNLRREVVRYHPSSYPPTAATTYALDTTVHGNGMLVAGASVGATNSVAVDPETDHVYVASSAGNEIQEYLNPGESYKLKCKGVETLATLTEASTEEEIEDALEAPSPGPECGTVSVSGAARKKVIFSGTLANTDVPPLEVIKSGGDVSAWEMFNGSPSAHVTSFQADGTTISNTIGAGIAGATYTGVDVYGKNGNVYVADKSHGKAIVFNPAGDTVLAEFDGSDSLTGAFDFSSFLSLPDVAVDQANGHAYVSDIVAHGVVDEFDGAGSFVSEISHAPAFENGPSAIAVDRGASSPNDGTVYISAKVASQPGVFAYGALSYGKSLTLLKAGPGTGSVSGGSSAEPNAIDCGSICTASFPDGTEVVLTASPAPGSTFGGWSGCDSVVSGECHLTMGAHKLITATFLIRHLSVSKQGSGTGTISGGSTAQPNAIDCGSTCAGDFPDGAEVTLTPSADPGSKFKAWSGCDSVTANQCKVTMGADRSVSAVFAGEPSISATEATNISSSSATLKAKLNPEGELTSWHFEYVDDAEFDANGFSNAKKVPAPDFSAGAGSTDSPVSQTLNGLTPGTLYHFRLVATNLASPVGGTNGPVVTFTTFSSSPTFDQCDNDALRTGASAKLPDCRAYEQVSPVDKYGNQVLGSFNLSVASPGGDAVRYLSANGQPDGVGPQNFPYYLARRGADAWSAQGVLPPVSYGNQAGSQGWLPDLSTMFFGATDTTGTTAQNSLLARQSSDGALTTISEDFFAQFVGADAEGSIAYFQGNGAPLTPDAVPGEPNLYAWDRDTNTLALAGVLPDSACATPPCIPSEGSTVQDEFSDYPVQDHVVSEDGSAYFSDADTGQLYLRKDPLGPGASTVHVSASQRTTPDVATLPASFQAATPDGEHAFFTSAEELTDESNTSPPVDPPGIGRADLPDALASPPCDTEPCNVDTTHLPLISTPPKGMTADATHLYWVEPATDSIARSDLDGSNVQHGFITGADNPYDVAVDSGHIYWTNAANDVHGPDGTIGRADLNGSGPATNVNQSCVTGARSPHGIAVNETLGFIYWVEDNGGLGQVGRAAAGGTCAAADATVNHAFINPLGVFAARDDIAVNDNYIYTSTRVDQPGGSSIDIIRRFDIDDGHYTGEKIFSVDTPAQALALAADNSHVYWSLTDTGTIGRADLDFGNPDEFFISGLTAPTAALAVGRGADSGHLYWAAGADGGTRGKDLYRYDADSGELTDLTYDPADPFGADVRGFLGASEDGSYVYFVANADLDEDGEAEPGDCEGEDFTRFTGECSIYLSHGGEITFVARLDVSMQNNEDNIRARQSDANNWIAGGDGPSASGQSERAARVSADGRTLLFRSWRPLTGYDNQGPLCVPVNATVEGVYQAGRCPQFYRYDIDDGLTCVSCNPTGAPPSGPPSQAWFTAGVTQPLYQDDRVLTRNLSADGNRTFFETPDKLVAADINGDAGCPQVQLSPGPARFPACLDLYMWEAEDTGSCESSAQNGGCLYLISTGTGSRPSLFLDASADGSKAFLFSEERLVPQDADNLRDVYVASVDGGLASQHAVAPAQCEGDACRGGGSSASSSPGAATAAFQGPGNTPQSQNTKPRTCPRGKRKVRRAGKTRCVKRHQSKNHKRAANHDRRAGR